VTETIGGDELMFHLVTGSLYESDIPTYA
jgi:hypothetical protein